MIVSRTFAWAFSALMLVVSTSWSAVPLAADSLAADKEEAISADRALLAGEWRVLSVEANGNTNADPVVARVTILNGLDGAWSLLANGKTIAEGTSVIDPTSSPKTIDLKSHRSSLENARGTHYHGIYEVHETTRRICFVPADKPLPESFAGGSETGQILVTFEKVIFE